AAASAPGEPAPLYVRTVEIDDPGDLLALLPSDDPASTMSWVRRGEGIVGWGTAACVRTSGPRRIIDADAWWRRTAAATVVDDEVRLPGTGPVAFGSFAFSRASRAGGVLVVPRVVVGRRDGRSWLTVASSS